MAWRRTIPYPAVTANHAWRRRRGGGMVRHPLYVTWITEVCIVCAAGGGGSLPEGNLSVKIDAYPPDKRRRDVDNLIKMTLDAVIGHAHREDDWRVKRILIEMHGRRHPTLGVAALDVEIETLVRENDAQPAPAGPRARRRGRTGRGG